MELKVLISLVFFLLLSCNLTGVLGIYCYDCNTYQDGTNACHDPMSISVPVMWCASGLVCTKVSYVTSNTFITSRSCDADLGLNTCNAVRNTISGYYPDLASFNCTACNTSYCNSGVAIVISLVTVVCGVIFTKIL